MTSIGDSPEVTGGFDSPTNNMDVDEMFLAVLDHLLTPEHLKDQLVKSQSKEKKLQTIEMHKAIFEGKNAGTGSSAWGDKENSLLTSIRKAKLPDLASLSRLRVVLASANKEFMISFLDAGGVSVLLKALDSRMHKKPLTELDVAALFEVLSCCKQVMNNSVGMDGFLEVNASIEAVALCLNFEYKSFSLLVLEILSVCCYYSEKSAVMVVHGMRLLARSQKEAPWACLAQALECQDIEVKAAVMVFVNSVIMGIEDINERTVVRSEFNSQLLYETYVKASKTTEHELEVLSKMQPEEVAADGSNNTVSPSKLPQLTMEVKLRRKSMITMYGPRAINEQKVDAMIRNNRANLASISETGSIVEGAVQVPISNNKTMTVHPLSGTMAGLLTAAKNEQGAGAFRSAFGGKSTKRRWYEVNNEYFGWFAGHEKENGDFKSKIDVNTITDVRPFTTDTHVIENSPFAFEIETSERSYALGCETQVDKDHWISALLAARDNAMMAKAAYKLQKKDLTIADALKYKDNFKKQGDVYYSIAIEDKRFSISSNGLDLSDATQVSGFARCEAIAAGHGAAFTGILHELLLIPNGADAVWSAAIRAVRDARDTQGRNVTNSGASSGSSSSSSNLDTLNKKGAEGGAAYAQMSKLALALMTKEQEVVRLQEEMEQMMAQHKRAVLELASAPPPAAPAAVAPAPPPPAAAALGALSAHPSGDGTAAAEESTAPAVPTPTGGLLGAIQAAGGAPPSQAGVSAATVPAPAVPVVEERYAKYVKMQKMLPEGAVRQKMTTDGFTPAEIDAFFANGPPMTAGEAPGGAAAPVAPDPRYEKYAKMQKMLPEGAVRQKMTTDGFTPAEIDAFFSGAPIAAAAAPAGAAAPVAPDPRYEKYAKMQKMLPEGAVRQKMATDGFTPAEIDAFFSGAPMTAAAAGAPTAAAAAAAPPKPPAPVIELPPPGMREKPKIKNAVKLKGLFWTKIKNSSIEGTVWHKLDDYQLDAMLTNQLQEWFATKGGSLESLSAAAAKNSKDGAKDKDSGKLISVLDATRTQNILIILGKLRKSPEDIIHMVIQMDPNELTHELTTTLIDILPTAEELTAVQAYKDLKTLDQASRVLFHFNRVPRLLQRMECHEIAFRWVGDLNGTLAQISVILSAKNEVIAAQKVLQQILRMVLAVGNTLNGDTTRGQAFGVKLDIFVKLVNLKAALPSQGTLMDFVAAMADKEAQKDSKKNGDLLLISDTWVATWAAADISLKQVQTDLNQLDVQINKLNTEFIRIKDSAENVGLDGKLESAKGPVMNPLWRRLDTFLTGAKPKMVNAKAQMKTLETSLEELMTQYGESLKTTSEEDPCKKFFSAIASFAKSYRSAVDSIQAARLAEERAAKEAEARGIGPTKVTPTKSGAPSASEKDKGSNIFGKFQASQESSADAVLSEFKSKLANRFKNARGSTYS